MFHWLARYLVTRVAQEKLRETVQQRMAEAVAAADAEAEELHQRPVEAGIVFAIETESGGTEDMLQSPVSIKGSGFTAVRGGLAGRLVVVVRSGAGRALAARATEALLAGHRPRLVISAGFAGGLQRKLRRADVVLADEVLGTDGPTVALAPVIDPARLPSPERVHVGRLVTVDRVLRLPGQKEKLGREHSALAVDMESVAVVELCRAREVPVLVVRVISDTLDEKLPSDVERLLKQRTSAGRWGAALGAALNRPGSIKDMLQLKENALLASDRLAKVLAAIVVQASQATRD